MGKRHGPFHHRATVDEYLIGDSKTSQVSNFTLLHGQMETFMLMATTTRIMEAR